MEPFGKRFRIPLHVIKRCVCWIDNNNWHKATIDIVCVIKWFQIRTLVADFLLYLFDDLSFLRWQKSRSLQISEYGKFAIQCIGSDNRWHKMFCKIFNHSHISNRPNLLLTFSFTLAVTTIREFLKYPNQVGHYSLRSRFFVAIRWNDATETQKYI